MLQCKYTYSQDTLLSGKSCKSLLLSQTIYLMIKLMMEDVMVNIALSTNGGKLCSFVVKSVVEPHDIWKQRQNLIISWCVCDLKKKSRGMSHFQPIRAKLSWNVDIFDQWESDFAPVVVVWFFEAPGWFFHF